MSERWFRDLLSTWFSFVVEHWEIFALAVAVLALFEVAVTVSDRLRVKLHLKRRHGRLVYMRRDEFGPGWFGSRDRIYKVGFIERDGSQHEAYCKTRLNAGVYFTDDRTVRPAAGAAGQGAADAERDAASLEEENRRLREEVERLRRSTPPEGEDR